MSYSELHIALTGLCFKCNRGTHYGFLKITMLQNHFASTFCNFNVRNKRNRKMVPVTLLNHSVHVSSRHLLWILSRISCNYCQCLKSNVRLLEWAKFMHLMLNFFSLDSENYQVVTVLEIHFTELSAPVRLASNLSYSNMLSRCF